jgi:hypothetical protein
MDASAARRITTRHRSVEVERPETDGELLENAGIKCTSAMTKGMDWCWMHMVCVKRQTRNMSLKHGPVSTKTD